MKNTGEQFILENSSKRLRDEHLARYEFAMNFAKDKKVLDIACGSGYGSNMLSGVAKKVTGVDLSLESINYAKSKFKNNNLEFIQGRAEEIFFDDNFFDLICSFETIEHLDMNQRKQYLSKINKSLKSDGLFILSTPNKVITSPYTDKPLNEYHVLEFTKKDLKKELERYFAISEWYGQRFIWSLFTFKYVRKFIRLIEIIIRKDFGLYSSFSSPAIKKWDNNYLQPRIIVVTLKK